MTFQVCDDGAARSIEWTAVTARDEDEDGSEGRASGVRRPRLWAQLLGVRGVIVGRIEVEEDDDGEIAG